MAPKVLDVKRFGTCILLTLVWSMAAIAPAAGDSPGDVGPTSAAPAFEPWQPPGETLNPYSELRDAGSAPATPAAEADLPEPVDSDGDLLVDGIVVPEPHTWYGPTNWFGPIPWDTGIELGINGSSGSSESLSIQTGGYIKRESRFSRLDLDITYNRTTSGGVQTQNNAQLDVRNDWLLDDKSPWTLFASANVFYDEFQAFDVQTNANSGVGYRFVHEPGLDLIGRFGAGASREFGGPDDDWVPEALFGGEYSQQLSATQKLYAKLDYFPEWEEFGEYRLVADAGWEIELLQPENLSLKVSASDRYDSTPNGAKPHLVNYSVLLLLKL